MTGSPAATEKDGRVLPLTRWVSLAVFFILVPALVILWGMPDRTREAWAWTIAPDLSPIFLGAGYGAGAYFFLRTFLAKQWHPSAAGVFGAGFFAALMLAATLLHWEVFNHGDAPLIGALVFYGWTGVYIVSPFLVLGMWWLNRRTDPGEPAPGDPLVSDRVRLAARAVGIGALVGATLFWVAPETVTEYWGWHLKPLSARVIGCFTAQVGVGALWLSVDRRWSAWKLIIETVLVATALLLVGAARAFDDFHTERVMTWLYLGGLLAGSAALVLLYRTMSRQERAGAHAPS